MVELLSLFRSSSSHVDEVSTGVCAAESGVVAELQPSEYAVHLLRIGDATHLEDPRREDVGQG